QLHGLHRRHLHVSVQRWTDRARRRTHVAVPRPLILEAKRAANRGCAPRRKAKQQRNRAMDLRRPAWPRCDPVGASASAPRARIALVEFLPASDLSHASARSALFALDLLHASAKAARTLRRHGSWFARAP